MFIILSRINLLLDVMSTIEEMLARERMDSELDIEAFSYFLYSAEGVNELRRYQEYPLPEFDLNLFNKSRAELIKWSIEQNKHFAVNKQQRNDIDELGYILKTSQHLPLSLHCTMFLQCIKMMGSERQQKVWFQPALNHRVFGCYAQTQLGHGSDVQNLETTATYNMENDTFTVNTPSISAAKCWPGDLGIFATHALVFAQMNVQGKNHGVHSFIVPIRDVKTFEALPGIEVGDIGPKFGFHTKDNGYLIMNKVVIPKTNMLRKFTSVSKTGEIKKKGNPKVSYATMMIIRQLLSNWMPRLYAKVIIIASRYSLFRTQFLTSNKAEIPIIDYQTQKDKIITRIAQYVAISISGSAVRDISNKNLKFVIEKSDFSLMAETHACLCLGKALFGEIVYDGMEICRKACGGHGFSHYSGIPLILGEYASNLTLEGENTIMYLQVTRYLLKNYKYSMTKKEKVGESVQYLLNFSDIMDKRLEEDRDNWKNWTIDDIEMILTQASCFNISLVATRMTNKPDDVTSIDVWNKHAGIEIRRAAINHGHLYIFTYFRKALQNDGSVNNREVIKNLCMLFGTSIILKHSLLIIEGGFITPDQISALKNFKELLLQHIRPHIISILDSFMIPDNFINSALMHGDPYDNYLELARKNQLNTKVQEAAFIVKQNMPKHMPKL